MLQLKDEMTLEEVADALRVHYSSVYRWIRSYDLKGERRNVAGVNKWMVTREQVLNYLKGLQ